MNIAYVRTSTIEQNSQRQVEALEKYNINKWYYEQISGKNTNRPVLKAMLDFARKDDTIYIHDFSRLARSTKDLLEIVEILKAKGIQLISNKENIDTSTATGKLMLTMIGAISEFERTNLLERQREGIEIATRLGKYKGRKEITINNFEEYYHKYLTRQLNKTQLAKVLKISRPTLSKLIIKYQQQLEEKKGETHDNI